MDNNYICKDCGEEWDIDYGDCPICRGSIVPKSYAEK